MEEFIESEAFLPLQQSPVYGAALMRLGATSSVARLGCGWAQVVERGRTRLVMRGPVWSAQADPGARRRALRKLARWCGLTIVTPEEEIGGFGLLPLVTPQHHAIWDISGDLRSGMAQNWVGGLRRAERAGHALARGSSGVLDRLIEAEARQRSGRGYRALPARFTRALPPDALRLWHWRQGGEVQAAMAFIRHGNSATYHLGWGTDRARATGIHALMLGHAAEALAAEGVRWLDLGQVDTEQAPGLARFKLGTGARLRQLGSTLLVLP